VAEFDGWPKGTRAGGEALPTMAFRRAWLYCRRRGVKWQERAGAASSEMVLLMAVVLPLMGFVFWAAPRVMNLVYEMTCVLVSWPFL